MTLQPQQQQQSRGAAAAAAAAAATASAAATAAGSQAPKALCRSNSTGSTVDTEQQDGEQQQQQQQQQQQREDVLVAAAIRKVFELVPGFFGLQSEAAAAAVAASAAAVNSSNAEQHQQQLLQGELLRGGTTNTIVKVWREQEKNWPCCLVRFYGRGTSLWIDRQRECAVLRLLEKQKMSKQILALFDEGVIESWVAGAPIEPHDLGAAAPAIAAALANLHNLVLDRNKPEMGFISEFDAEGRPISSLWPSLRNLIRVCMAQDSQADEALHMRFSDFDFLCKAADFLEMAAKGKGPVVLCHGDLLAGNIIKRKDNSVCFIDFEYAAAMERGFDIANHFIEYGGFDCDWSRVPSPRQQTDFLRVYLQHQTAAAATAADLELQVELLREEIKPFFAVSHLYWGVWALFQAANSTVDFNFSKYAFQRLEQARLAVAAMEESGKY